MIEAAPFSILLIHPPPASSDMPPLTLTQAKPIFSDGSIKTRRWHALPDEIPHGGKPLLALLEQLSARYGTIHLFCLDEIEPDQLKGLVIALNKRQPGLRLSLRCLIDRHLAPDVMHMADGGAIVQIQWRLTGPVPDFRFFKTFSRAGIWNHLVLDGVAASPENEKAVVLQPNIVHSWETIKAGGRSQYTHAAYSQVHQLPGRPLWQTTNNTVERFLLVDRLTQQKLLRLRIADDGQSLYTVGEALAYHFLPPGQLPNGYLDEICAMVAAGGTVATNHVRFNLERAFLIGYALENGIIVGNSCLKNPRPAYIDFVRRQSGLDLTGFVERGYTSVRPEYRGLGIGTKLLEGLTQRTGDRKIFSVIGEDNTATQIIATRNRTRKVATYFSEKAGKPVGIWMPEWMIDTDETASPG